MTFVIIHITIFILIFSLNNGKIRQVKLREAVNLNKFSKKAAEIFLVTAAVIGWGIIIIAKPFKKKIISKSENDL